MRTKLSIFVFILVLALVLSACGTAAAQAPDTERQRQWHGLSDPRYRLYYIGVHTEDPNLATGVSKNNTQAQALVDALKNAGIAAKDIQTSNFSVYTNNNGQTLTKRPAR